MGWSHIHVSCVKIWEQYLGSKESQTHTTPPAQDSSARYISPHNFWLQLLKPQAIPLKEPTHGLTYSDSLPLSSSTGVAA